jgi:hypothetical protein
MTQGEMFSDLALEQQYDNMIKALKLEQETLEEAAKKQWGNVHRTGVLGFIEGVKWQQEQDKKRYSEEEVLDLLHRRSFHLTHKKDTKTTKEWFEPFKKK